MHYYYEPLMRRINVDTMDRRNINRGFRKLEVCHEVMPLAEKRN